MTWRPTKRSQRGQEDIPEKAKSVKGAGLVPKHTSPSAAAPPTEVGSHLQLQAEAPRPSPGAPSDGGYQAL